MTDTNFVERFARSAQGVLLARVVAMGAVFGFNSILARTLPPEQFGTFVFLFSVSTLAALVANLGLNRGIVKKIAEDESSSAEESTHILRLGILTVLAGGAIAGTLIGIATYFLLPSSAFASPWWQPALVGGIVLVRAMHLLIAEAARGFQDRFWSNMFGGPTGGPAPHLLFVFLLLGNFVVVGDGLINALVLYFASFVVTLPFLLAGVFALPKKEPRSSSRENRVSNEVTYSSLLLLGIPLMLTQVCGVAIMQADIWIAGAMTTTATIAIYAAAQRMLGLLTLSLQIAGTAILNIVPELASKNRTALQKMVSLAASLGGIPGIILAVIFVVFAEQLLAIVFGSQYESSATILRILTLGQIVCLMTGPCEVVLMMSGHQKITFRVNLFAALAILSLGPVAVFFYEIQGLAVIVAAITSVQNLTNCYLTQRLLGVSTHVRFTPLKNLLNREFALGQSLPTKT